MAFRKSHPELEESRVIDVDYNNTVKRPIDTVRNIYQRLGYTYTKEFEALMQAYIEENPQGKGGRNQYSLEMFGLDGDEMTRQYKDYVETYCAS